MPQLLGSECHLRGRVKAGLEVGNGKKRASGSMRSVDGEGEGLLTIEGSATDTHPLGKIR